MSLTPPSAFPVIRWFDPADGLLATGESGAAVLARRSGYIRYVDINRLVYLAREYGIWVRLERYRYGSDPDDAAGRRVSDHPDR
jgi:hypothetical protein